jgi:hypothetical protein
MSADGLKGKPSRRQSPEEMARDQKLIEEFLHTNGATNCAEGESGDLNPFRRSNVRQARRERRRCP